MKSELKVPLPKVWVRELLGTLCGGCRFVTPYLVSIWKLPPFPSLVKGEEIIVFPDGHLDKGTLVIIKDGFINVNASGLPRQGGKRLSS